MPDRQAQASAPLPLLRKHLWLPLMLLPGLFTASYASTEATSPSLAKMLASKLQQDFQLASQRSLYQQAEQAYKKRQFARFKRLTDQLSNYPLHPYLEYKSLTRKPASLSNQQINDFLQANDDTVIGDRFRVKLIKHASKNKNWQSLIDIYRPGYGTGMECLYLNALIKTHQTTLAYPKIQNLWLSEKSLPKSCDTTFGNWEAAGNKTPELIWQRFKLAITARNTKLARYLVKSMPSRDANIAKKWLQVHRKPELVTSSSILQLKHAAKTQILIHGLKRLSSRNVEKAIKAFHQLKNYNFNEQQIAEINRSIGLKLARAHMPDAGIWLARIPSSHVNKQVKEWRIRTAIRQGDWFMVLNGIDKLALDERAKYRWQYWWAYANEQMGNENDALGIYQYLANKRSYYGFLAADHLNLQYAFEDKPLDPSIEAMQSINQQAESLRAREFYFMGQIIPARREWQRLINRVNNEQRLAASKLAQSWDWHDRAIITMGKTRYRDDIELRFPLMLENKVHNWSNKHNIEAAWTYAIIRRESAFMQDARSSVGAMGLMQLMPNTARHVARQLKIRYKGTHSLLTSNLNIRLGTGYLERMLDKLSSQHVLATAAYNAGPHRVEQWLPEHQNMDAIRWIETIPFTETREYVSNVLAYMVIYEHRMDREITRLSHRMPPVPAKNPQAASAVNQTAQADQSNKKDPI